MLTDQEIKGLVPQAKPYRVADAQSMVVHVAPTGSRSFRLRYRIKVGDAVKERELTLGAYPAMGIKKARIAAAEARKLIAEGKDPSQQRRVAVAKAAHTTAATFDAVFTLLAAEKKAERKDPDGRPQKNYVKITQDYLMPSLRGLPLADITSTQLHDILNKQYKRIPATGAKLCRIVNEVYRYAHKRGIYKGDNPAQYLVEDFQRPQSISQPSARECTSLAAVLRDIDTLTYFPRTFLRLIALTFVRSNELRLAEWSEFDLDAALWVVPASRMKMGREHRVPLSAQAVAMLRELHKHTEKTGVVFPAILRRGSRFMSESTFRKALGNKLEYVGEHSTHGFRGSAGTILDDVDFPTTWVNLSIAHWSKAKGSKSDAAYNSAEKLPQRRAMMQAYADYLDAIIAGDEGALESLREVRRTIA